MTTGIFTELEAGEDLEPGQLVWLKNDKAYRLRLTLGDRAIRLAGKGLGKLGMDGGLAFKMANWGKDRKPAGIVFLPAKKGTAVRVVRYGTTAVFKKPSD